ncbi:DUF296 domain-containing protein [Streptomyces sp. NPDC000151]|uniref:PCC domain-containing protein n=1 Tax=Streptomyces sp. NPDC000151 TaxID=3154244 RepID=UPI00332BA177
MLLPPRVRLIDALADAAHRLGVDSAQVELLSGTLGPVHYCIPAECPDGSKAVGFSATRTSSGPVSVLAASATLGRRDGAPFMHCHAAWLNADGVVRAGHLWPETTVGQVPPHAVIHPLPGVHNRNADDPETLLPVFTPHRGTAQTPTSGRRVAMSRLLPGEDVRAAADAICVEAGFRRAVIRASVGSLVGPTFRRSDRLYPAVGAEPVTVVGGPCTEVMALFGEAGPDVDSDAPLHAIAVDSDGAVHGGVVDTANSPVAVTVEVLVIEDAPRPGAARP